jgi:hypothetical protein
MRRGFGNLTIVKQYTFRLCEQMLSVPDVNHLMGRGLPFNAGSNAATKLVAEP